MRGVAVGIVFLALGATAATADDPPSLTVTIGSPVVREENASDSLKGVAPAGGGALNWLVRRAEYGPCAAEQTQDPSNRSGPAQGDIFGIGYRSLPGGAFDIAATPRVKAYLRSGDYVLCAWMSDSQFETVAMATAPTTVVRPQLSLHVTLPSHPRKGALGTFIATGHAETAALLDFEVIPAKINVCDESGTKCRLRPVSRCPATTKALETLQERTPDDFGRAFVRYDHAHKPAHGTFRLRDRLRAETAGKFYFCGYATEDAPNAPASDLATATSFATFRVRG